MKLQVYSIRDIHTGFMTPTVNENDFVAVRNFEHAMSNSDTLLNSHPGDFELYCLGDFDSVTGEFVCSKRLVVTGQDAFARRR